MTSVLAADAQSDAARPAQPSASDASPRRLGDVRIPYASRILTAAGIAVFGLLVWRTIGLQFSRDEWNFVSPQPGSGYWAPIPSLIYHLLAGAFSLRTHIPEEVVMLGQHVIAALLLFRVLRRRAGDLLALAAALVLLVLGWGSTSIVVCCAGSAVGAVIFGLAAIDLADGRGGYSWRVPAAAVALLLSLACSAVGLAFVAVVLIQVLLQPDRRSRLAAPLIPVVAFVIGYLVVGRNTTSTLDPWSVSGAWLLARYVAHGVAQAGLAATGFGGTLRGWPVFASPLVIALIVVVGCWGRVDGRVLGALAGMIVEFVMIGLVRGQQLGAAEAGVNQYMYVAVVLLALLVTPALARVHLKPLAALIFAGVVSGGLIGNGDAFRLALELNTMHAAAENVALRTVNAISAAPDLETQAFVDPVTAPGLQVGTLFAAEHQFGLPVTPARLGRLAAAYPILVDRVLRSALARGLRIRSGATVAACVPGVRAFDLASAGSRALVVGGSGAIHVALGWATTPALAGTFNVKAGLWTLHVPDTGVRGFKWHVVVRSAGASVSACSPPRVARATTLLWLRPDVTFPVATTRWLGWVPAG